MQGQLFQDSLEHMVGCLLYSVTVSVLYNVDTFIYSLQFAGLFILR
jgi:hypothetical protein